MSESWRDLGELHFDIWGYSGSFGIIHRKRSQGGPLESLAHFARNCPHLRILHLPSMTLSMSADAHTADDSPDTSRSLQTLIVPKFTVEPHSDDPANYVVETVRRMFPAAAWAFKPDKIVAIEGWVVASDATCCLTCKEQNFADIS